MTLLEGWGGVRGRPSDCSELNPATTGLRTQATTTGCRGAPSLQHWAPDEGRTLRRGQPTDGRDTVAVTQQPHDSYARGFAGTFHPSTPPCASVRIILHALKRCHS